ncbi:MAG: hypothetical protein WKG00_07665 [Polyangiaceae bacterium]
MSIEVLITFIGVGVAGLAAMLGIWMERDKQKPPRYAYALSLLILMATVVSMFQTYQDAKQGEKMEAEMARMLQMLDKIASSTDVEIPELSDFVKTEIATQSRTNPTVVQKMAQRMADEGEDPAAVLGSYLPPSEVEGLQRKGTLKVAPPKTAPSTAAAAPGPSGEPAAPGDKPRRRPRLAFGAKADPSAAAEAKAKASADRDKEKEEAAAKDAEAKNDDAKDAGAADAGVKDAADAGKDPPGDGGAPKPRIGGLPRLPAARRSPTSPRRRPRRSPPSRGSTGSHGRGRRRDLPAARPRSRRAAARRRRATYLGAFPRSVAVYRPDHARVGEPSDTSPGSGSPGSGMAATSTGWSRPRLLSTQNNPHCRFSPMLDTG